MHFVPRETLPKKRSDCLGNFADNQKTELDTITSPTLEQFPVDRIESVT